MPQKLAHIADDGREQTIKEHLDGTARLCSTFADSFGAARQGFLAGSAHDIGKNSDAFQLRLRGGPKVDHATAGAVECARIGAVQAACCVAGHHGGMPDVGNAATDQPSDPTLFGRLKKGLNGGIPLYSDWKDTLEQVLPGDIPSYEPFALSFWTRMLYSCLVDADYLDTERFMANKTVPRGEGAPLAELLSRLEQHIQNWGNPKTDLNRYRCAILEACLEGASHPKGLFTLTVPTGGGKTIASLAFALRHALIHHMRRVVYVIPYTSIIEQTAAVFREVLGEENVLEHHSGVCFDPDENSSHTQYRQALAAENWDAPVIVTTSVQFFESLYANRPSQCRKLHRLANSVIIFDEAQMLPTAHLRPCVAGIACLAAHFGATAVMCTATQPVLRDLFQEYAGTLPIMELNPKTQEVYKKFRRVCFHRAGTLEDEELAAMIARHNQALCIVNTRKAADLIYSLLPAEDSFHLSTLMYPAHRQAVLAEVRFRLRQGIPCRVVSTSLIEAGVDIDFPAVFREMAGLDSILQAAGRCNREGKRSADDSVVTIFTRKQAPPPLFRVQIGAAAEALAGGGEIDTPQTIQHYFSSYRALAGNALDKTGVLHAFQHGLQGCNMPFRSVADHFYMIEQNTKTVYIPLGEGAVHTRALMEKQFSKKLFRQAGRYAVSVYEQHFKALLAAGDITALDNESAVLQTLSLYRQDKGLSLEADWGKAEFC